MLYCSICDSSISNTYFTLLYAEKLQVNTCDAAKYYVTGTDGYTKYLVTELSKFNSIQGCNIAMDWYFTSVNLGEWAMDHHFTIVGTMYLDRKGIPKVMKLLQGREQKSILHAYHNKKDMMMLSYINKKKSGKKNIAVFTTMHDKVKVTSGQRSKAQTLIIYNHTKSGVDVVDLISCHHSTRIKSKHWLLNALAFMLDTLQTNAKTILEDNKVSFKSLQFMCQLGKYLVLPNIQRRLENPNGLWIQILQNIRRVLGLVEKTHRPLLEPENCVTPIGCCYKCVEGVVGIDSYKKDRDKMNNKLKSKCRVCASFISKKHQFKLEYLCENCFEEWHFKV